MSRRFLRQAEDWVDELQENIGELRSRGRERLSEIGERIPAKPLFGIALAIGAGFAIASLLHRRK